MSDVTRTGDSGRLLVRAGAGIGAAIVLVAAVPLADGMGDLRGAYLYRESSGEGIALAWVAARLVAGGLVALVGIAVWAAAAAHSEGRMRATLRGAAFAALGALSACTAVALWVGAQSGCIGACG